MRWMMNPAKTQMWKQLGSYCLFVFVSSLLGAVSIIMAMKMFDFHYQSKAPGVSAYEANTLTSTSLRFRAVWMMLFQVQVFFGVISRMMLLGRLSMNAALRVRMVSESKSESGHSGLMDQSWKRSIIAKAVITLPMTCRLLQFRMGSSFVFTGCLTSAY